MFSFYFEKQKNSITRRFETVNNTHAYERIGWYQANFFLSKDNIFRLS